MIGDVLNMGLRAHSYVMCAKVLSEIYKAQPSQLCREIITIDCYSHPGWLAQQLYRSWPSFKKQSTCNICGNTLTKDLTGISIDDKMFKTGTVNNNNLITKICSAPNSNCLKCQSQESVNHKIIEIDNSYFYGLKGMPQSMYYKWRVALHPLYRVFITFRDFGDLCALLILMFNHF